MVTAVLTKGDDNFSWTEEQIDQGLDGDDVIPGLGGNDLVNPSNGDNKVFGGAGNDDVLINVYQVLSDPGKQVFHGGEGIDRVTGGQMGDFLAGGTGRDKLNMRIGDGTDFANSVNNRTAMTADGLDLAISVNGAARATIEGVEKLTLTVRGDGTRLGTYGNDAFYHTGGSVQMDAGRGFDQVNLSLGDADLADAANDLNGGDGRDLLILGGGGVTHGALFVDVRGTVGRLQLGSGPEGTITGFALFGFGGTALGDTLYLGNENDWVV